MATMILGITGKKGSGKDTFAARLVSHHGFTRLGFADPLKSLALSLDPTLGYDANYLCDLTLQTAVERYGWDDAKKLPAVRGYLQTLGVSVREYVGENAWVQALATKAALVPGPVVVTDVRFINEAKWVQSLGELVRVNRPDLRDDGDRHASETELDAWIADHVVVNDGSVEKLHTSADHLAAFLRDYGVLLSPSSALV